MNYVVGFKNLKNEKNFIDFNNLLDALKFIKANKEDFLTYAMLEVEGALQ